ncbi:MAG: hypothetical protein IAE81_17930 [Caldilineaceae bacterium]|jgi:hypothetical protein|nr:hypothetical protein [Caldilineaceae bacterium]
MNKLLDRIAAALALLVGVLGVFAGGQVLLGRPPGWNVVGWLPVFNFAVGVLAMLIVAPLIWRGSRYALPVVLLTFGANGGAVLVLLLAFRDVVARESLVAMTMRLTIWAVILLLMFLQLRRDRPGPAKIPG